MRWKLLPIPRNPGKEADFIIRLNALGSLYFFEKMVLQRRKLSDNLHQMVCRNLENDRLRYLLEMPRDHNKTTMVTEGRTMWRALPFDERDEAAMRAAGYDDAWIAWMRRTHDPARRALVVNEVLENAIKIGWRIDWHYTNNDIFKRSFPEIIPDASCIWNNETKQQRHPARGPHGEGTFDFMGVGSALQSRHYHDIYEDDVVGKDALKSTLVMNDVIDYHKLLIGAFESYSTGCWTVVNNRWSPTDLSSWIRENDKGKKWFIETHSALGGCCEFHPEGIPIYPEEFTVETLEEIRQTQGPYFFSHQYLNLPINPEDVIFDKNWLRFYGPTKSPTGDGKSWLRHEVLDGEVMPDINPRVLIRSMVIDPNHREEEGRARHAIVVTGIDPETDRVYLLDTWAESRSYEAFVNQIYRMAELWGLLEFWVEGVGFQRFLKYHFDYRNKVEGRRLKARTDLKTDRSKNGKRTRIESMTPILQEGRLWVRHDQSAFLNEYYDYPGSRTVDILDCLGYAPQTWNAIHAKSILDIVNKRRERQHSRRGYYA